MLALDLIIPKVYYIWLLDTVGCTKKMELTIRFMCHFEGHSISVNSYMQMVSVHEF
jgi:hypothetical protein